MEKRARGRKIWGIEERVLFVALMPAAVIAIVLAGYFLVLRYTDVEESLAARGRALVRQLAPAAQNGVFAGNRDELHHLAETLIREPDIAAVNIYDRNGALLARAGSSRFKGNPLKLPDGWEGKSPDRETLFFHTEIIHLFDRSAHSDDGSGRSEERPPEHYRIGSVVLEVSRAGLVGKKREMLAVTLVFTMIILAAGGVLAYRLGRDVLEPIISLEQAVAAIRGGRFETRVPLHRAGTLRALEEGVNEMAAALEAGRDRLEQRIAAATAELKQKKEEAERANIAKSRFLAAASHDLRQPLHALSLFAAELEYVMRNSPQQRLARQIGTAVGVMSGLLESLLDISRLDSTMVTPVRENFPLMPLFEHVLASHGSSAKAKGLSIRVVPTSLWVNSDPRLLERMVGNLVCNAVRYTETGGIIVGARRSGDEVRIEVWDSGVGIDDEHRDLVFQEFFQVGNPERDPGKGLGLGLAIVERTARRLGHRLLLRSQPQRGSVFGIVVPRVQQVREHQAPERTTVRFEGSALVICPPGPSCDSLISLMRSWGLTTHWMDENETGVPPGVMPDVVIFDESCTHVAALLANTGNGNHSRTALILVGEAGPQADKLLGAGNYLRLSKPLRPAKLRALVQAVLQRREAGSVTV